MAPRRPAPADPGAASAAAPERGRRHTINDVARLSRVSKKTVSRVINDSPSVADETRERVNGVIRELGYAPDPQARGLALRRSLVIGLVYDDPNPQGVVDAQQGILDAATAAGVELMVRACDRNAPDFLAGMRAFLERGRFTGVVLFPPVSEDERLAALLTSLDTPYIRVVSAALDAPSSRLVTDDAEGARAVARHLTGLGHRRVGLIAGPPDVRWAHERRRGFEEGLAEAGLRLDPAHVEEGGGAFGAGVEGARRLLAKPDRPTAVFALNDEMAAGAYRVAHALGLAIPQDLSVAGFDDAPIAARLSPPLTSVRAPVREAGRIAAEILIARARRPEPPRPARPAPRLSPRLVVRGSTGPVGG